MRLCRADDLEAEFVDLLKRIRAKPELVAAYRKKSAGASGKTLERSLRAAKDEVADLDRRRDKAWALNAAGKVRDDDLQERLDKLGERRRELESNISALEERLSLAAAAIREDRDADAVLSKAAKLFSRASDEDRRRIARAVSVSLGGLCVAEPGDLVVRRVEETERQRRKKTGEA
jgi:chromosome segregation ATPase